MGDPTWFVELNSLAVQIASSDWTNLNTASSTGNFFHYLDRQSEGEYNISPSKAEHSGNGQSYDQQDYINTGETQQYNQSQLYQQQHDDYHQQQNQNLDYQVRNVKFEFWAPISTFCIFLRVGLSLLTKKTIKWKVISQFL